MPDLPTALRAGSSDSLPLHHHASSGRLSDLLASSRRQSTYSSSHYSTPTPTPGTGSGRILDENDVVNERGYFGGSRYEPRRDVSPPGMDDGEGDMSPLTSGWTLSRPGSTSNAPGLPAVLGGIGEAVYRPVGGAQGMGRDHAAAAGSGGARSMLDRLGTLRGAKRGKSGRYGVLNDVEEDGEHIGVDISGFEGPMIELRDVSSNGRRPPTLMNNALGGGMGRLRTVRVVPGRGRTQHRREGSWNDTQVHDAVQREAERKGEIVAVEELADLSVFDGSEQDRRSTIHSRSGVEGEKKKETSYYFPDDPEKPSWRPFSMRPLYISILVVLALLLAGLQEFLCQRSEREKDGLLRFNKPADISTLDYFTWKYMPTMVLVVFGVLLSVVDFEVKRLEPYTQLSKKEGASAPESLNLDYLTFMSYLIPMVAVRYKQWAVVCSSVATLLGNLLPVLSTSSLVIHTASAGPHGDKIVKVQPVWSRLLTATLVVIAALELALLLFLRRKSGLLSDPKGIAGVAAMATKSHILADFRGLDVASNATIHRTLRSRRYILHKSSLWQGKYERLPSKDDDNANSKKGENPLPIMLRLSAGIPFLAYLLLYATLLPVFIFVPAVNAQTARVPWLLTALATGIKLLWGTLDMTIRVLEPYYLLSRRHAPADTLTLDYTGTVPGYLSLKAALNGHFLVALVSAGAILSELLTVLAASFAVDGRKFIAAFGDDDDDDGVMRSHNNALKSASSQTARSFWISFGLSLAILLYLLGVGFCVYRTRRRRFLPREPGSIAGVLAYIHSSRMLDTFIETERLDSGAMTRHLRGAGKTYGLGWFRGRDGEDHCGVDEEPILRGYKHGYEWDKARMGGNDVGGWEHF